MNAEQIVSQSVISQLNILDTDQSLDNSKSFADIKVAVVKAINVVNTALPKMKAAGADMKKASGEVDGLMRNIIRKNWGANQVDFYVTRNGSKAITTVTQRHVDDVVKMVSEFVANF